jgi:micrococcal nuclease
MKKLLLLLCAGCIAQVALSQTIVLDSAANYEGKTVTVCAKVQGAKLMDGEKKTVYLNFGKPYPNHTFTVVIFGKDFANFSYAPAEFLKDKTVCITGTIKIYKDKPEMIITKESEIKIQ